MHSALLFAHAHHFALALLRLVIWLALLSIIFIPLERFFMLRTRPEGSPKAIGSDLCFYFLSSLAPTLLLSIPLAVVGMAAHAVMPPQVAQATAQLPLWSRILLGLVIGEIGFYWGHRWSHQIPLLWRFHAVHHSPDHVSWLVNTRAHPIDEVFTRLCGLVPLYVLGLASPAGGSQAVLPVAVLLIATIWGFFIHANIRWRFGPLEWIVATPAFHHWHHTNDGPEFINKNFSSTLPIIDRLFGTHYLPDHSPRSFGLDRPVTGNVVAQLKDPFRRRRVKRGADTPEA